MLAAVTAARNAMYACFVLAAGGVFLAISNALGWLDVVLFLMTGIGIRQLSRVAAVTGLLLYLLGWLITVLGMLQGLVGAFLGGLVLRSIITAVFVGGVRAAFFANRLGNEEVVDGLANPPVIPEGRSRISVMLEEMPRRVWPHVRTPFFVILLLLTGLNLAVVTAGFLKRV
jgi:hypothetical protein